MNWLRYLTEKNEPMTIEELIILLVLCLIILCIVFLAPMHYISNYYCMEVNGHRGAAEVILLCKK